MSAAAELYDAYPASFDALTVNNIMDVEPAPGIQDLVAIPGGAVDRALVAMAFADPTIRIRSLDVQTILAACSPLTGLAVSSAFEVQYQKRADGGLYTGAGANVTLNGTKGLLIPEDFGADQDSQDGADINLMFYALSTDGYTVPVAVNTAQNLTGSPAVNALHALGPVVFEGGSGGLKGVQRVRVRTGIEVKVTRAGGGLFGTHVTIRRRQPLIEIEGFNLSLLSTTGFFQSAISAGVTVYLQKVAAGGGRVAFATAEHLSVTAATGKYKIEGIPVQKQGDANTRLTVVPTSVLAFSTGTAITLPA